MQAQELFSAYVRRHFEFLTTECGCTVVSDEYSQELASCVVVFGNSWRRVSLVWGLRDAQFYFAVERLSSKKRRVGSIGASELDRFYIFSLAFHHEPDAMLNDFGSEMSWHGLDVKKLDQVIERNALCLREYGGEIMMGRAWYNALKHTFEPEAR